MKDDITTEKDVTLDVVAALDMYAGSMGSDTTVIDSVGPGEGDRSVVLVLSDGSEYRLRVAQIR